MKFEPVKGQRSDSSDNMKNSSIVKARSTLKRIPLQSMDYSQYTEIDQDDAYQTKSTFNTGN
jgi:hypothetical protein